MTRQRVEQIIGPWINRVLGAIAIAVTVLWLGQMLSSAMVNDYFMQQERITKP